MHCFRQTAVSRQFVVAGIVTCVQAVRQPFTLELASAHIASGLTPAILAVVAGFLLLVLAVKKILDTPSRKYDPDNPNVGESYDAWEQYVSSDFQQA